jgi:uncharacterized protein (DUF1778 family)
MVNSKPRVRTDSMRIRCRPEDKVAFLAAAARKGVSLSGYVVLATARQARADEGRKGEK